MKVAFCSAFNRNKDGIADYSGYLAAELKKRVEIQEVKLDYYIPENSYYLQKAREANFADIIHIQFNYIYFNGDLPYRNKFCLFLKHLKKPVVVTVHEIKIGYEPITSGITSGFRRLVFNNTLFFWNFWSLAYQRNIFKRIDKVIAHTKEQYRIITRLVKNQDKIIIIPHGIPIIGLENKNIPGLESKKALNLEGKRVLSIFGFINKRKGYELVLGCLAQLPEDIVLVIAGGPMSDNFTDRQYSNFIERKISALGLKERVRLTGYLKPQDIPEVMAATDICLAPFKSLSASGALSLCLGYNKPIIASDIDVHREINNRFKCLEMFRQGDGQDFFEKIKGLLNNPGRSSELAKASQAYSNEFSYSKIAEKTVLLYEDILSGKAKKCLS